MKKQFAIIFLSLVSFTFLGAQSKLDSLQTALTKIKTDDTSKVNVLNGIAKELRGNQPDKALIYVNQAQALAEQLAFTRGMAAAYNTLAIIYRNKGDFNKAINFNTKAIKAYEELGNKSGLGSSYNTLGLIFKNQGFYLKAIDSYIKSSVCYQEAGEYGNIPGLYNNIGVAYKYLGKYSEALDYYFKALAIEDSLGNQKGAADCYSNIGNIYAVKGDHRTALDNHRKAFDLYNEYDQKKGMAVALNNMSVANKELGNLAEAIELISHAIIIHEKLNSKKDLALDYTNIGQLYCDKEVKDFKKGLDYLNKALEMQEKLNDQIGIMQTLIGIAQGYNAAGRSSEALVFLQRAEKIADETEGLSALQDIYMAYADVYEKLGAYKNSLFYYKKGAELEDSLFNKESSDKLSQLQTQYDLETQKKEAELEKKKNEVLEIENKRNKQLLFFAIAGAVLLMIFIAFMIRAYAQKQKQKTEIEAQKEIIEIKNKDITDSIQYAKRIQEAILTPEHVMQKLFGDHFIFYKPRDIISGDFYWAGKTRSGKTVWAAVDCTGHGVPGALMSMVGSSLLNDIVHHEEHADDILNKLREGIIEALQKRTKDEKVYDGMDIALCVMNSQRDTLEFAGAQNPLYIIRDGALKEMKADKQPIGHSQVAVKPFTRHTLQVQKGDCIYLFTDGYADQFGGEKGKKYTYKRLQDILITHSSKPMTEQKEILYQTFSDWKKGLEQVDDVCLLGVRI